MLFLGYPVALSFMGQLVGLILTWMDSAAVQILIQEQLNILQVNIWNKRGLEFDNHYKSSTEQNKCEDFTLYLPPLFPVCFQKKRKKKDDLSLLSTSL